MKDHDDGQTNLSVEVVESHDNTSQHVIRITRDRLKLVLIEYEGLIGKSNAWHVPLGIFLTIFLVLCTAEFKSFEYLSKATLEAFFILCCILSFGWLVATLKARKKAPEIDSIVDLIANKNK